MHNEDKCKQTKSESKMNDLMSEEWKWREGEDTIKWGFSYSCATIRNKYSNRLRFCASLSYSIIKMFLCSIMVLGILQNYSYESYENSYKSHDHGFCLFPVVEFSFFLCDGNSQEWRITSEAFHRVRNCQISNMESEITEIW